MIGIQDLINSLPSKLKDKKKKNFRFDIVEDALCFKDGESFKGIPKEPTPSLLQNNKDIEGAINVAKRLKNHMEVGTLKTFINIMTNKESIGYTEAVIVYCQKKF